MQRCAGSKKPAWVGGRDSLFSESCGASLYQKIRNIFRQGQDRFFGLAKLWLASAYDGPGDFTKGCFWSRPYRVPRPQSVVVVGYNRGSRPIEFLPGVTQRPEPRGPGPDRESRYDPGPASRGPKWGKRGNGITVFVPLETGLIN